nr:hypothetical protein [Tanacetum cinerariifolium]
MSLLQKALDAYVALTRRVEHLEYDKVAQALEIKKLKRRVKKLENGNRVKVLKLRRLKKVGTSQRIDTSDDTDNDVTRLEALVDKKKVVVTEAAIREVLRLDDAEGVDCLPNEEIFAELVRMGYEKPSTKLIFYKAIFSSQWKFLIHTILQSMKQVIEEGGDAEEHVKDVTDGDASQGDDTAAYGKVSTVSQEPSIPSPTPPTSPPQPPQDLPSTSQRKIIDEMGKDNVVTLMDDKEEDKKDEEAKDEAIDHVKQKAKEDPAVQRYQAMKRKPQTEAQA